MTMTVISQFFSRMPVGQLFLSELTNGHGSIVGIELMEKVDARQAKSIKTIKLSTHCHYDAKPGTLAIMKPGEFDPKFYLVDQ